MKSILCLLALLLHHAAFATCPGGADWCQDFESVSAAVAEQGRPANRVLRLDGSGPAWLAAHAGEDKPHFVEARLRAHDGAGQAYVMARYVDARNWLGFGLEFHPAQGRTVAALVRMEDGKLKRLKQVGMAPLLPGVFSTLRLDVEGRTLTLYLNGARLIGGDEDLPAAGSVGLFAEGGAFEFDDLRTGPLSVPPASIGLAQHSRELHLQAGDGVQAYPVRTLTRREVAMRAFVAGSSQPDTVGVRVDGDRLLVTPLRAGEAVVSVMAADDNNLAAQVLVKVDAPFEAGGPLALQGRAAPLAEVVPVDTRLRLEFDMPPQLGKGSLRIVRAADGRVADVLHAAGEVNVLGASADGVRRVVRYQAIRVNGNSAIIQLHDARLEYDTEYLVLVDAQLFPGARLGGQAFSGIGANSGWRFRTGARPAAGPQLRVAATGAADFRTVQGAFDYVMRYAERTLPVTISVADGEYDELLYLRGKDNVTLRGDSRAGTRIAAENNDGANPGVGFGQAALAPGASGGRSVLLIEDADMVRLDRLSLVNTSWISKTVGSQAEALNFSGEGRLMATDANFVSEQDTIFVRGYSWFYRSLIAGNVDFIWGNNHAALFEESEIRSLGISAPGRGGGYLVQARTLHREDPGFVFLRSRLTHGPGPAGNDIAPGTTWLARPGPSSSWDKVSFIDCRMDVHIAPAGWFGQPREGEGWTESGSMDLEGHPLDLSQRRAGRVLTTTEADALRPRARVFTRFNQGQGWQPQATDH
ncbi:pectinesterase family protein [Massilia sp. TS11]|uniref:pectinesterase family protein n=1 Tax=Massilia sp. TS11 TaxID=2908003 RepID=UPI001EDC1440|nr:pectinesterase family protein [Massilia sp. TS11]MCG2583746.1 pectinesterase family protein [Massilia sp. TS11]